MWRVANGLDNAVLVQRLRNIALKIVILGLRCYTCDTDGSGSECITNPGGLTSSACTEGKDYCFTYRREDQIEGSDPSKYPRTTLFDEKLVSFVIRLYIHGQPVFINLFSAKL